MPHREDDYRENEWRDRRGERSEQDWDRERNSGRMRWNEEDERDERWEENPNDTFRYGYGGGSESRYQEDFGRQENRRSRSGQQGDYTYENRYGAPRYGERGNRGRSSGRSNRGYGRNYDTGFGQGRFGYPYNYEGDYDWNRSERGMDQEGYRWQGRSNRDQQGRGSYQGRYGNQRENWRSRYDQDRYNRQQNYSQQGYDSDWEMDTYDYDYEDDLEYAEGPTWTYTELWWIPGPMSGLGPSGYQRSDDRIKEDVCDRLTRHGQLDASDIEVDVNNGEVTLKGTVNSSRGKRMAEDAIASIPGVWDIHNQLHRSHQSADMGEGRGQIHKGMEVTGKNGENVGTVKKIRQNDFLVDRSLARDVYVPFSACRMEQGKIKLDIAANEVDNQDWEQPQIIETPNIGGQEQQWQNQGQNR